MNPEEEGERHFKLLLSQTDKATLKSLVEGLSLPDNHSLRVSENLSIFQKWIKNAEIDLTTLCKGLAKLVIVDIALNREQDNPQLIFESMNSTGKELSQADLIRNFILMGLQPKLQTRLYEQFWRPMELDFGQEAYGTHFDGFMRHYLTLKTGTIPNINAVYDAFKAHARETRPEAESNESHMESLVSTIREYSRHFCAMTLDKEPDKELKRAFHDLCELKVDVAYPFLMELYHYYALGLFSKEHFVQTVRWIEAYVFRRAVCEIPTNSMNKTFATFIKALKKDRYLESIAAHFRLLPSYRRFPFDDEFERSIQTRDLYNFRNRSYWLRRFENYERKETAFVSDYTIEHILPQNENLSASWRLALGKDWKQVQQTWLHTLGNLTLTGYNSEYRDRPFTEKRDMAGGFKHSPLTLNRGLEQVETWDELAIIERAKRLAKHSLHVWSAPKLEASVLASYRPKVKSTSEYTLDDHPYLLTTTMQPLFEAFRREVLALDPCVSEDYLKQYVAYKAESNFVDVVPQSKRLRLSLNMRFAEVSDPKGLCKDVSNIRHWGNGDVEVSLSTLEELPYVVGLIRQALEKQLGESTNSK